MAEFDVMNFLIEGFDPSKLQEDETEKKWKEVIGAYQNEKILQSELRGIEKVRNTQCAVIQYGPIKGYIPLEESGYKDVNEIRSMTGQPVLFKIVKYDKDNNIFVASRKKAQEQIAEITLKKINIGDVIPCVVKLVSSTLVVGDIGGIQVRIPVEEMGYGWVDDLHDIVKVGHHLKVKVISIDKDNKKVKVSAKAAMPNPYPDCAKRFIVRGEYSGTVSGVRDYGIFVNLEPGVDSLAPHLKFENVKKGDKVLVKILNVDTKKEQIRSKIVKIL